jgi:hypothetical protein
MQIPNVNEVREDRVQFPASEQWCRGIERLDDGRQKVLRAESRPSTTMAVALSQRLTE